MVLVVSLQQTCQHSEIFYLETKQVRGSFRLERPRNHMHIPNTLRRSSILSTYASTSFGAVIGVVVAMAAAAFVQIVQYFQGARSDFFSQLIQIGPLSIDLSIAVVISTAAVGMLAIRKLFNITRWHGPADTIYAAHQDVEPIDIKTGIASTLAALVSACGAASVGQYGPLVHFGATAGAAIKKAFAVPMPNNVVIGCGVAAAISAGFNAPIAGIIFAHEAVVRHFSPKAMAPIATSAIAAAAMVNYVFQLPHPLTLTTQPPALMQAFLPVVISAVIFGFIAILFMFSLRKFAVWNQKLGLSPHYAIVIAVFSVIVIGSMVPSALGLGTDTLVLLLESPPDILLIAALLFAKIVLTSICLGFGFFGGIFSPALLVGAASGALLAKLFEFGNTGNLTAALTLAGMASVAACVVGAPLATVFIVLELTLSYEFTLITLLAVVVSQVVSTNIFGHSFFDRQLLDRGIDLRYGRSQLSLNQTPVAGYATQDFIALTEDQTADSVLAQLRTQEQTEAYVLSAHQCFVGKVTINQILEADGKTAVKQFMDTAPLILKAENSLSEAIEAASSFVGESIPVVAHKTGKMIGVVSEADLFAAYLEVQENIRSVEK